MKKELLQLLVLFTGLPILASAPWFDAGIKDYDSWPERGADKRIEGVGAWTGTTSASLAGEPGARRVSMDSAVPTAFGLAVAKSVAEAGETHVSTRVLFSEGEALPPVEPGQKGSLTVATEAGVNVYYGLVAKGDGTGNEWTPLTGAVPTVDDFVDVNISFRMSEGGGMRIRYAIGDVALLNAGAEWSAIVFPEGDGDVTGCAYLGRGEVAALSGVTERSVLPVSLTLPELEHVQVKAVSVAGLDLQADEAGVYWMLPGTLVTVTFAPEPGYALNLGTMTFSVPESMTLPEVGRPVPVDVRASVTINEVMAKNGGTVRTTLGFEGLDWVEVHNRSEEDVDLTGWCFGNDPTKKPGKWPVIEGSCIVPAKGYKVLWCDGDGLCPAWADDEAHVACNISTDAGKHTLFLASEASVSAIVQQLALPGGIKDVSYGLGHLSRTLVPATASAQYRVGAGAWTEVAGAVGMSAATSGFRTVEYRMNRAVDHMDVAEACLKDPSSWKEAPRTNAVACIAFGGGGTFDASLYSDFPGFNADDTVLVATGTVRIPESGDWSFAVGSDDGFAAKLTRPGSAWSWESRGARGYQQSVATFNLEAGSYGVELVYFNRGGGRVVDFSAAKGRLDFDVARFAIVGTAPCPVVHAGALGAQIAADVADEMLGRETELSWRTAFTLTEAPAADDTLRLLMRYTDGFTAKLNGETVVSVPAAGARTAEEALRPAAFAIPATLAVVGTNTLEIVAVNDAAEDTELLVGPELKWDVADDLFVYSTTPTPGAANAAEGRTGFTPKVAFSRPHGYQDGAFMLELSCPDNPSAVIYYTLDGTSPSVGRPNTLRYEGAFEVAATTVVRAAVPDADSILQQDASATYLFLSDILAAGATPPAGFPADKAVNSQVMRYGMETFITQGDAETQERLCRGFTNAIRTVSLVIDPEHLFDRTKGIYVNASGNGRDWERPVQVEQINPADPSDEFAVPAGLRIRGAVSRGEDFAKHSFRLFFRSEYGMGTLNHALFGEEGAGSFEKIDLRTEQNYAWANGSDWQTFVHEVFARDSQRDMGENYNRSRYYHLFINGVYWGLYQTEERVDQSYGESYAGGAADNYDVVRTSQPGYNTGVVEGEGAAWEDLWRITTQEGYGAAHPDNYNRVRGLDPDGTRNPALPVYVNVTNLITFMITAQFAADSDAPANGGGMANNIAAYRNRVDGSGRIDGFLWNRHDAERSLARGDSAQSGTATLLYGTRGQKEENTVQDNFNPAELHYELCANAEYRLTFADLVYRHILKTGGAMTAPVAEARFRSRMAEIDDAIVCEAARWGGGSRNRTRATWLNNCADSINFINHRIPYLIRAYRELGWYPSFDVATLVDAEGNEVLEGQTIAPDARLFPSGGAGGTVYYTTDGSDPKDGGTVFSDGLSVPPEGATVAIRVLKDGEWSALNVTTVKGEAPAATLAGRLAMSELYTSTANGGDTGEYIVLTNLDETAALDLSGVTVVAWNAKKKSEADPSLTIALGALEIPAGGSVTLDQATYFGAGKLTNSRVGLKLYEAAGGCIQEVAVDADWWGKACDGTGRSFVALAFGPLVDAESQWKASEAGLQDWPEDPETEITDGTTPADLGITSGAFATASVSELRRLSAWAKANAVPFAGEEVNGAVFAADGLTLFEEAYLLNCPPTAPAVEAKKADFRFTTIEPGVVPSIAGDYNGTVTIWGATRLSEGGDWAPDKAGASFFKATLTR